MKRTTVFFGMLVMSEACFAQSPSITIQPQDQTNLVGATVRLYVEAQGAEPLAYQWTRNGWSLGGCTTSLLELKNLRASDAASYSVVVTNSEGSVTSRVAQLTVVSPPAAYVKSAALYGQMAVYRGSNISFTVGGSGTQPLSYMWRFEGRDILGATNKTLAVTNAEPKDEGDYMVFASNPWGSVTSAPARLYVTPPAAQYVNSNFVDEAQQRLPYFLLKPDTYDSRRSYPLVCVLHGTPGDETLFATYAGLGPQAIGAVYNSYQRQQSDPAVVVWPARRAGDAEWTPKYIQQLTALLGSLSTQLNVDTNRIYLIGMSEGVHAVWDCLGSRPTFFAGAVVLAGWTGSTSAASFRSIPTWAFCAAGDDLVTGTRDLVRVFRQAGGSVLYTEYASGGHMDGIAMGLCTPVAVEWLLAQRRGQPSSTEPVITITQPTSAPDLQTAATNIDLSCLANALGQPLNQVSWTNLLNNASGLAAGTNTWRISGIPLKLDRTNTVIVVATTTSWASPLFGGATTFNDAVRINCAPIRLTLTPAGTNLTLSWKGGGPPFSVQRNTELSGAGQWIELRPDATPPVTVTLDGNAVFYRIIGR